MTAIGTRETQLRSIGSVGTPLQPLASSGKGFVDPFAEIFARMAAASPTPSNDQTTSTRGPERDDQSALEESEDTSASAAKGEEADSQAAAANADDKSDDDPERDVALDLRISGDESETNAPNDLADESGEQAAGGQNALEPLSAESDKPDTAADATDEMASVTGGESVAFSDLQARQNTTGESTESEKALQQKNAGEEVEKLSLAPKDPKREGPKTDDWPESPRRGRPLPVDGKVPEGADPMVAPADQRQASSIDSNSQTQEQQLKDQPSSDSKVQESELRKVSRRRYSNRPDPRAAGRADVDPNLLPDGNEQAEGNSRRILHAMEHNTDAAARSPSMASGSQAGAGGATRQVPAALAAAIVRPATSAGENVSTAESARGPVSGTPGATSGGATASSSGQPATAMHSSATQTVADAAGNPAGMTAAGQGDTHNTLSALQRAKLVQRVSRGFQHIGRDGGQIRLRLSPDHLGSVALDLEVQSGRLNGQVVTQSEAASRLIQEHLPELRAKLESQGIKLESIEVLTESETGRSSDSYSSGGQSFGQQAEHRDASNNQQRWVANRLRGRAVPGAASDVGVARSNQTVWTPGSATDHVDLRL